MPRKKSRGPRSRRLQQWAASSRMRFLLLTGHDFYFFDANPDDTPFTDEELADAWEELGAELVAAHIAGWTREGGASAHPPAPGSRPWGWWLHEAPEPRRRLADRETIPPAYVRDDADWRRKFGLPTWAREFEGYETQADYLGRHGLLTPAEVQALEALAT